MIPLIGPGGAAKSTVGALVAERLGLPFVDLDRHFQHCGPPGRERYRPNPGATRLVAVKWNTDLSDHRCCSSRSVSGSRASHLARSGTLRQAAARRLGMVNVTPLFCDVSLLGSILAVSRR
jgi:hypothetical protein